ncbi:helix-turn-helix transcriptional regulator [Bounagaea algeriensis]
MTAGATERVPRLLTLVPYLLNHPGIRIAEAAADFGVTEQQLRRDLELLWMCGLPGYGPGDLIDLSFDSDTVTVTFDAGMRRPLRLTTWEATALLVALRALADTPGTADAAAVRGAAAKIEEAVGQARPTGVALGLDTPDRVAGGVHEAVRGAVEQQRALWLRYYTASRDAISERTVDPMRMLLLDGHHYLEAWCRRAAGVRLFRLDRIDAVERLDEPSALPAQAEFTDVTAGSFPAVSEQPDAVLDLALDARWVAEYYPVQVLADREDGGLRVRVHYADRSWIVRLLLGLGGAVRVVEPAALAEEVRHRAVAALARTRHRPDT